MSSPIPTPDTEKECADLLVRRAGKKIRYCVDSEDWYSWQDNKWVRDPEASIVANYWTEIAEQFAKTIQVTNAQGAQIDKPNVPRKTYLSAHGVANVVALAKNNVKIRCRESDFDNHPYELNTPNGSVDLRTGKVHKPDPIKMHTKETSVSASFERPTRWIKFLEEVFQRDDELIEYVQRLCGLSLIGEVVEQIMPFAYGPGGTGKSTFFNTLLNVVGDYGEPAPASLLMRSQQHQEEIARLRGVRIVIMLEFNQGDNLDSAKLKSLTGSDKLAGRFMKKNTFSFRPTHTLFLAGNHNPSASYGGDSGLWRRMKRILFLNNQFQNLDKNLQQNLLKNEGPEILGWFIQGAVKYLESNELYEAKSVLDATREYEDEEDYVARFIDEMCVIETDATCSNAELWLAFSAWTKANGTPGMKERALKDRLLKSGKYGQLSLHRSKSERGVKGIKIDQNKLYRLQSDLLG